MHNIEYSSWGSGLGQAVWLTGRVKASKRTDFCSLSAPGFYKYFYMYLAESLTFNCSFLPFPSPLTCLPGFILGVFLYTFFLGKLATPTKAPKCLALATKVSHRF